MIFFLIIIQMIFHFFSTKAIKFKEISFGLSTNEKPPLRSHDQDWTNRRPAFPLEKKLAA